MHVVICHELSPVEPVFSTAEKNRMGPIDRGHPYGVEPLGNIFLRRSSDCRPGGLGKLAILDDERMLDFMGYMDMSSLGRLAVVSRATYVYAHVDDLWKALVVQEMWRHPGQGVQTRGGWKTTLQHMLGGPSAADGDPRLSNHVPLKVSGFFSDLLFQPHHCATAALRPEWISRNTVDRRVGLSPSDFRRLYEEPNRPVVLTDAAKSWPALERWTRSKLLAEHGDLRLHAGGLEFALKDYLRYAEESKDELPLYVFDKKFVEKCPALGQDYNAPDVFPEDLLSVLGDEQRPDHRWFIAGPARSGSSFHVDPNCTSAWNATISGKKKWILFPPGETPPGVHPSEDGLDLAAPVSLMEWFLNFYEECHDPGRKVRPLECVVSSGEVVFVPMGWWHCVINLEWSVAITQNFVSRVNLPNVIRFLLTKKHLISGLPPDQRLDLGERFVSALTAKRPDLGAEEMARRVLLIAADGRNQSNRRDLKNAAVHRREVDVNKKPRLWAKLKQGGAAVEPTTGDDNNGKGRAGAVKGNKTGMEVSGSNGFSFGFSF